MPDKSNPPHIERMIVEQDELETRLDNLSKFIFDTEKFEMLDKEDQKLLRLQYKAMEEYSKILNIRINKYLNSI